MAVERIWDRMFRLTPYIANKAVAMQAISAIDLAVWDLIGKALDTPVHRLLGGCKSEIPIIGYTYFEDGTDTMPEAELVLSQKEQGYAGTKLKVGDEVVCEGRQTGGGHPAVGGRRLHPGLRCQPGLDG